MAEQVFGVENISASVEAQKQVAEKNREDTLRVASSAVGAEHAEEALEKMRSEVDSDAEFGGLDRTGPGPATVAEKDMKGTDVATQKSLSKAELDQIAKDINDGLHKDWLDWNVQETKVIEAISKVPAHQMESFLKENFGGRKEFLQKITDADAFHAGEYAAIVGKIDNDIDQMALALDELMVDKSVMDYANADAGVALMKGLSDADLKAVLAKTNTEAIKKSVEIEFSGSSTKQIDAYAQLARGGVDTYSEIAEDVKRVVKYGVAVNRESVLESIQDLDSEKLFAADKDLKGEMLKLAQQHSKYREKTLTFVYGKERGEALVSIGNAMDKPESAADFISTYKALSEEQKTQFKKDFAEVYGEKHGKNIDIAISNSLAKDREAWVDTMNAMDNGHSFDKETVMDMDDDTFNALVEGTNERTIEAVKDSAYDTASVKADKGKEKESKSPEVKAAVEAEKKKEYTPEQENILTYCKEYSIHPERLRNKTMKGLVVSYVDSLANSSSKDFNEKLSSLSNEQKDALIAEAEKWTPETGTSSKEQTRGESQRRFKDAFISKLKQSKAPEKSKSGETMVV